MPLLADPLEEYGNRNEYKSLSDEAGRANYNRF
jgi:hypothetical protein